MNVRRLLYGIDGWALPLMSVLLALCFAPGVRAQTYELVERRNPWIDGRNATGIRLDSVSLSRVELYVRGARGDLRDPSAAPRAWSLGAEAKTIAHEKRFSMIGSFSFDHTSGRDVSGSMFIDPGYYPVDMLEFTPGRKDLQTYAFTGGLSSDVAPHWRVGAKIGFSAANYAKFKDLRHYNYRLDMNVAPGVMYHTDGLAIGIAYVFEKNTESLTAEEIGTSDTEYYAFLDKGLMYGAYELWSGNGTHLSEAGVNGFPIRETAHGAAIQLQWGGLYGDVEYLYGSGSAGEKTTVWFEFPSHRVESRLAYRFGRGATAHFLRLHTAWSRQTNHENVLGKKTVDGITLTYIYGSNRIFERESFSLAPEYEVTGPRGEARLGLTFSSLDRTAAQMYPYVVSQSTVRWGVYASGTRYVGRFDLKVSAGFARGSLRETERTVDTAVEAGDPPYRLEDFYRMQNEYMTAPRLLCGAACRYRFAGGIYAEIGADYAYGFNIRYLSGHDRWSGTALVGYTF